MTAIFILVKIMTLLYAKIREKMIEILFFKVSVFFIIKT